MTKTRTGAEVLVDQLIVQGTEHVFCVPGESYLAVLDALHDAAIRVTVCRQEAGAGFMADAVGRLSGRPGICFVTRGPGSTNAAHAIHVARQDSIPLIMFVGQIDRSMREREAFQEVDYRAAFGPLAKWATEIDDAARIPELVARAFSVAMNGRPGPVVIALPEDMLTDRVAVADAPRAPVIESHPGAAEMAALQARLLAATNPVMIVGGTRWTAAATADLAAFAKRFHLPVATSFRRQMLVSPEHPSFIGDLGIGANPALIARIRAADLVLAINARLSEMPSQSYTLFDIPGDGRRLIHVFPQAEELNRVYATALPILSSPVPFAAALAQLPVPASLPWAQSTAEGHQAYLAFTENPAPIPGDLQLGAVMQWLRNVLPADAILANGAGNYTGWLHRYYRFRRFGTQLAPTSGSMGYGLPAAVGAKRAFPDRTVVCLAGDGCFLMNGQEFATAVQYDLPILVLIIDNGMYGTIRMHQEREYPGRVSATRLRNPDFAAYARAFGGHGETVRRTEEFAPAFERARASGKPAILHCLIDPEAITTATTLSAIRDKALEAGKGRYTSGPQH